MGLLVLLPLGCGQESQPPRTVGQAIPGQTAPVGSRAVTPEMARQVSLLETLALAGPEQPDAPSEARPRGAAGYQGPPPARVRESRLAIDRTSPRRLLAGTLRALAARDLSALARLSRDPQRHPHLSTDDAQDARRRFLAPAVRPYWTKVRQALQRGAFSVRERGARATVRVEVGGAAGSYRIELRKKGDQWYLAG